MSYEKNRRYLQWIEVKEKIKRIFKSRSRGQLSPDHSNLQITSGLRELLGRNGKTFWKKIRHLGLKVVAPVLGLTLVIFCHVLSLMGIGEFSTPIKIFNQQPNVFCPADYTWTLWALVFLSVGRSLYYRYRYREDYYFVHLYDKLYFALNLLWMLCHIVWLVFLCKDHLLLSFVFLCGYLVCVSLMAFRQADSVMMQQFQYEIGYAIGLHAAWVLVVLLIQLSTLMGRFGVSGIGLIGILWAVIFSAIGLAISYYFYRNYHNVAMVIPMSWTLLGIALKERQGSSFNQSEPFMAFIALAFLLAFLTYVLQIELTNYRRKRSKSY